MTEAAESADQPSSRDGWAADRELFAELYPRLRAFAAVVGPSEVEPDDLVQEALARVLRRGGLARLDLPEAYLRRAIVNLSSNHRRTFARRRRAITRLAGDVTVGSDDHYASDIAELGALPPLSRAALYLRIVERYSYDEIGALLDTSPASMRMTVSRALEHLRSGHELDEEGRT